MQFEWFPPELSYSVLFFAVLSDLHPEVLDLKPQLSKWGNRSHSGGGGGVWREDSPGAWAP